MKRFASPLILVAVLAICYFSQQMYQTIPIGVEALSGGRRRLSEAQLRRVPRQVMQHIDPAYSARLHRHVMSQVGELHGKDQDFPLHLSFKQKAIEYEERMARLNPHETPEEKRRRLQAPTQNPTTSPTLSKPPTPAASTFLMPSVRDDSKQYIFVNFVQPITWDHAREFCDLTLGDNGNNMHGATVGSDLASAYQQQGANKKRTYKQQVKDLKDTVEDEGTLKDCWVGLQTVPGQEQFVWAANNNIYDHKNSFEPYWLDGFPTSGSADFGAGNCVVVSEDSGAYEFDVVDCITGPIASGYDIDCAVCENPCYSRYTTAAPRSGECVL